MTSKQIMNFDIHFSRNNRYQPVQCDVIFKVQDNNSSEFKTKYIGYNRNYNSEILNFDRQIDAVKRFFSNHCVVCHSRKEDGRYEVVVTEYTIPKIESYENY